MQAFRSSDLVAAISAQEVELVFSDAGLYSFFERSNNARALATVTRLYSGTMYTQQGGVVFRRRNRHSDLETLQDLRQASLSKSLIACPVDALSFAGWRTQWYEFFKNGMNVGDIFANSIVFSGSDEESVRRVMIGACDVGMVSADAMLALLQSGSYLEEDFAIIDQKTYSGFNMQVSTSLYNEWPLAALPHVDDEVSSEVRTPLLGMRFSEAASIGKHSGFVAAASYKQEANLLYQLKLMNPSFVCAPGSSRRSDLPLQPCLLCEAGRANEDGLGDCRACAPGKFSAELGELLCQNCGEGTTTHIFGAKACQPLTDSLIYDPILECQNFTNKTLKVGLLLESELDIERWKPTFETELNNYFNRYECYFKMVGLKWTDMEHAIETKMIDLLFCDPGSYIKYQHLYGLRALSSVLRIFNGQLSAKYGGVLFRHSKRNQNLFTLTDLARSNRSLVVCPVSLQSFGGFTAQNYELFKMNLKVEDFGTVVLSQGFEDSVAMVATGKCDIGMVRTEVLERLIIHGIYQIEDFVLINAQQYSSFYQMISTQLYPEWPLTALAHVPDAIADVVSLPLLALRDYSSSAMIGSHAGFTPAFDYTPVSRMRYDLALELEDACGPGYYRETNATPAFCKTCPAGYFTTDGIGKCVPCPKGSFSALEGSDQCLPCLFGFNTVADGEAKCTPYYRMVSLDPAVQYIVWVLSIFFILLCLFFSFLVVRHRDSRLIKASSFAFNVVLIVACGAVSASTILFAVEPGSGNWICSLRWWLPCVASSTVFGALFSKTYRLFTIFRIYETKQKVPHAIRFKDTKVAALVLGFVLATALVLALYFLVDPPFYELKQLHLEGQNFYTYINMCHISKVFVPLIFTLYTLLLCCQSWLAFRVRKLPTIFNESQLIAWLLYNTVFVGLVGIMVDFMLSETVLTAKMMVRSMAILLGSITPVCVLFLPKFMEIYRMSMNDSKYSSGSKDGESVSNKGKSGHTSIAPTNFDKVGAPYKSDVGASLTDPGHSRHNTFMAGPVVSKRRNQSALSNDSGVAASEVSGIGTSNFHGDIAFLADSDVAGEETFELDASVAMSTRRSIEFHVQTRNSETKGQPNMVEIEPSKLFVHSPSLGSNEPIWGVEGRQKSEEGSKLIGNVDRPIARVIDISASQSKSASKGTRGLPLLVEADTPSATSRTIKAEAAQVVHSSSSGSNEPIWGVEGRQKSEEGNKLIGNVDRPIARVIDVSASQSKSASKGTRGLPLLVETDTPSAASRTIKAVPAQRSTSNSKKHSMNDSPRTGTPTEQGYFQLPAPKHSSRSQSTDKPSNNSRNTSEDLVYFVGQGQGLMQGTQDLDEESEVV
eukprot:gb/GEZN01000346.1/.p1 GENE.gb/GEZN01000346.1/~~gb/GEZN01000346.1/.p1  ORF type:complete len:1518 (-),score=192.84 gb/GEZN01000346.1/:318-4328(-)